MYNSKRELLTAATIGDGTVPAPEIAVDFNCVLFFTWSKRRKLKLAVASTALLWSFSRPSRWLSPPLWVFDQMADHRLDRGAALYVAADGLGDA